MKKIVYYVIFGLFVAVVANVILLYWYHKLGEQPPSLFERFSMTSNSKVAVEYKDYVAILLSAISVGLTGVGLGFAALAVFGYATIKDHAIRVAREVAEHVARETAMSTATDTAGKTINAHNLRADLDEDNINKFNIDVSSDDANRIALVSNSNKGEDDDKKSS
jgi:glucose-6-phosphate-specific signal transduction histidine kinase